MTDHPIVPYGTERGAMTLMARLGETAKTIITAVDQIKRLEREDERTQTQIRELTKLVVDLAKSNAELIGMLKSVEKRLDDKDKLVEALIAMRVRDEVDKRCPPPGR